MADKWGRWRRYNVGGRGRRDCRVEREEEKRGQDYRVRDSLRGAKGRGDGYRGVTKRRDEKSQEER